MVVFPFFENFTPTSWGNDPIWLSNIFQMGWNHQPDLTYHSHGGSLRLVTGWFWTHPRRLTAGYPKWWALEKVTPRLNMAIVGIYVGFLGCRNLLFLGSIFGFYDCLLRVYTSWGAFFVIVEETWCSHLGRFSKDRRVEIDITCIHTSVSIHLYQDHGCFKNDSGWFC